MPTMPKKAPFCCPRCKSKEYVPVVVKRPCGCWFETEFFECFGCSVMFHDPEKFGSERPAGDGVDRAPRGFGGING
jgi:hypothetical protein